MKDISIGIYHKDHQYGKTADGILKITRKISR